MNGPCGERANGRTGRIRENPRGLASALRVPSARFLLRRPSRSAFASLSPTAFFATEQIPMDRPIGPRDPDKRHTAYESIFGRPITQHQQSTPPPPAPVLSYPQPYSQYPYPNHQYQQSNLDRQNSYTSYASSSQQFVQPAPQVNHRTSYYHSPQPQPQPTWNQSYPYRQQTYAQSQHLPQSYATSVVSNHYAQGVLAEEPPNLSQDVYPPNGLTPAQAYQAQVYRSSPVGQKNAWASHQQQPQPPQPPPYLDNDLPQVGLNIDADNGRLGLDFSEGSSPSDTDDGSELPWARPASTNPPRAPFQGTPPQSRRPSSIPSDALSSRSTTSDYSSVRPYPLHLDTAPVQIPPALPPPSSSPVSSVHQPDTSSSRPSSDSVRTMPSQANRRDRTVQDRTRSVSSTMTAPLRSSLLNEVATSSRPNSTVRPSPPSPGLKQKVRRTPIVYPALLSRVAEAFRSRIALADRVKDGLTYKDAFDGRQAVDKIAYIIKTTDRNLALLLGRALDAQKYFHAVTYDHRLRDSAADVYQFRGVPSPFVSGEIPIPNDPKPKRTASGATHGSSSPSNEVSSEQDHSKGEGASPSPSPPIPHHPGAASDDLETALPTGVFTLLTDCYSPTCTRDQLCYSITCPRRLEQQARLKKPQNAGLANGMEKVENEMEEVSGLAESGQLWIHSVPAEIVNSVSDLEKRRQEAINEVVYTERDFVRAMEYLRDSWITPLKTSDVIPESRRADFIEQVFWNVHDILAVNTRLRDALSKRQKQYAVVESIADIFLDAVPHFAPFVTYGAHQMYGKYEFEKERAANPAFAQFVEETERKPESLKLELNGYLTKPTTRLARYPLLLEAVAKHTPDDSPDKETIPKVVAMVREFLKEVNLQTGKAENRFSLLQLDQQLVFRPGEEVDLRLKDDGREQVYKGTLKRRGGSQGDSGDLVVFLFDHALLMVKQKRHGEQYKVYRRPIPLELLFVATDDNINATARPLNGRSARPHGRPVITNAPYPPLVTMKTEGAAKGGFPITFAHLGRKAYQITLWASTQVSQRKWLENIAKQQDVMRERSHFFEMETLSEGFFIATNAVKCAAPFNQGRQVVYGTYDGVYFSDLRDPTRDPVKVLALTDVEQVDVLDDYGLLIVLSEGQVITFPLEALEAIDPMAGLKRAKRIASHTSFFKTGVCMGRTFVCVVKTSPLSSTIKILEPIDQNIRGRSKPTFRKLLQGGNDTLRIYKEFYIPVQSSSIHFLRTRLCVACVNGFDVIDPESLDIQGLLDPSDESLEFVRRRNEVIKPKPMAIYRIDNEFLLCYDEYAFYINRSGWRSRRDFMVHWEGSPTAFALHYPYVLAFEPTFVEIRNVETGAMAQIIQGNNLRCLFTDVPSSPSPSRSSYPSSLNGHPQAQQQPYVASSYGGRSSTAGSVYSNSPVPLYPAQFAQGRRIAGRDEILMVSDDRVLTLRMCGLQ
ncbi:CNH domain-containing protein [Amylostereum chailletii]|nr:CNH domain-containing protein [Amylostereum chailletii]